MLRVREVRNGEDAIANRHDECAIQIFRPAVAAVAHIGVYPWLKSKNSVDTFRRIPVKRQFTSGPPWESKQRKQR
jgi:hypothetical protein